MLSYNELKPGIYIVFNGEPYRVEAFEFLRMQQRKPVAKTKIKNLITGKILDRNFQQSDSFEEAEIERIKTRFLYSSRAEFWFSEVDNPKNRFSLKAEEVGEPTKFLKPNLEITALKFKDKIINIELPIKVDYEVVEVPPGTKGDTVQGGTKVAVIETGAKISVPLFINEGDMIKVNTQTGEYAERVK
ncbi:MAG: Elongation factor P [Actinobacteria bacterium]|nr:Elongation factor P [Actinomycetota bacterium]